MTNDAWAGQNICSGVTYISLLLPWSTNATRRERQQKRRAQQPLRSQIQSKSGFRQLSGANPALATSKTLNPALIPKLQMKGIPSLRPPHLHVDPGKVRDAVDALLGMGHPLVEGLDAMARGVSIGPDRYEDVELEDKEMAEGDDDVGTEGGDARDPMDEVDELDNDESSSESGKLSQVHQEP